MNLPKEKYRFNLIKYTNTERSSTKPKSRVVNTAGKNFMVFFLLSLLGVFYASNTLASNASDPSDLLRLTSTSMIESECEDEFDLINAQLKSTDSRTVFSGLLSWYKFYKEAGAINPEGGITEHIQDFNANGIIDTLNNTLHVTTTSTARDTEENDYHWVYFHLGRNGDSLYAIDFTVKDSPKMMWEISPNVEGFEQLGQTWSKPKIAYSKFNLGIEKAYEVLIFAGGYDTNKDKPGFGTDDEKGNAIYMVDAKSGALIWSLDANTALGFKGVDSIPSAVSILDSNGDGFIERLYVGDTGGNIWRVNMPTFSVSDTSVQRFASLGRHSKYVNQNDQRFYHEPTIVRSVLPIQKKETRLIADGTVIDVLVSDEQPFDIILIGSGKQETGYRSHLQNEDNDNSEPEGDKPIQSPAPESFYMLKDSHIMTVSNQHTPVVEPIDKSALYNLSADPFSHGVGNTTDSFQNLYLNLNDKQGWYIDYKKAREVTTSTAWVISNKIVFTTSSLFKSSFTDVCSFLSNEHWLYGLDLQFGQSRFNWENKEGILGSRMKSIGKGNFDQSKRLHIKVQNEKEGGLTSLMVGSQVIDDAIELESKRLYLYVNE